MSLSLSLSLALLTYSSASWEYNPQPAKFRYATRCPVCKLCIYYSYENYKIVQEIGPTIITIFTSVAPEPVHRNFVALCQINKRLVSLPYILFWHINYLNELVVSERYY